MVRKREIANERVCVELSSCRAATYAKFANSENDATYKLYWLINSIKIITEQTWKTMNIHKKKIASDAFARRGEGERQLRN